MGKKLTFRRKAYDSKDVSDLGESVASVVSQLNGIPMLSGELIRDIQLNKTSPDKNTVRHRLGTRARGAIVVLQSKEGDVSVLPSANSSEVSVSTNVTMTISLWVF